MLLIWQISVKLFLNWLSQTTHFLACSPHLLRKKKNVHSSPNLFWKIRSSETQQTISHTFMCSFNIFCVFSRNRLSESLIDVWCLLGLPKSFMKSCFVLPESMPDLWFPENKCRTFRLNFQKTQTKCSGWFFVESFHILYGVVLWWVMVLSLFIFYF